jgi:outer membrane protein assembly factor BamB
MRKEPIRPNTKGKEFMRPLRLSSVILILGMIALTHPAVADDWPQWMGPTRDGVYHEEGIVDRIPAGGLKVLWKTPVANGYSGPAVAGNRVYVTDYVITEGSIRNDPGGRVKLEGQERVRCFDASTGEQTWTHAYARPYDISYPNGPRATPAVDGDHVYALGAEGDLHCLHRETGNVVWHRQLAEEFNTQTPIWGFAAHPLVHGDLVYTLAGGEGSAVLALNKLTGETVWQALTTKDIGYCPPVIYQLGGREQLIVWHSESINALDPATGAVTWTYPLAPRYQMSIAAPQLNGKRLFASGIGEIAAMIELDSQGKPSDTLWTGKPKIGVYSGNATVRFEDNAIYGADCGGGRYIAVNPADGSRYWETTVLITGTETRERLNHGTAFTVKHQDKHLIFAENGDLIFAKLTTEVFSELGRMHVLEPTAECFGRPVVWSHPAYARRCVFARNDQELVCVSLQDDQ